MWISNIIIQCSKCYSFPIPFSNDSDIAKLSPSASYAGMRLALLLISRSIACCTGSKEAESPSNLFHVASYSHFLVLLVVQTKPWLYSEYRILEHERLSRLAKPVLDTYSKQIQGTENLKKKITQNPMITGEKVKRKMLPPQNWMEELMNRLAMVKSSYF